MVYENVQPLDYYVSKALDFIDKNSGFHIDLPKSKRTLVIGSQNGYNTGKVLYRYAGRKFICSREVQAKERIDTDFDDLGDVMIVSATGSREVVGVAEYALKKGLAVNAIMCNPDSELKRVLGGDLNEIIVPVPTAAEPPTINTVTYGMMIYGITNEDPKEIRQHLESISQPEPGYQSFDSYSIHLHDNMPEISDMVCWKLREIFGGSIGSIATYSTNFRHGGGVRLGEKELYIGIGIGHDEIDRMRRIPPPQERRHIVEVPDSMGPLAYMMTSYHIIGQIQRQRNDSGFKEGLLGYN